jgi:hypothetical protein
VSGCGEIVAITGELLRRLVELSFYVILGVACRETVVYLKRHLVFEPWGTGPPMLLGRARPHGGRPRASGVHARLTPGAPDLYLQGFLRSP